MFRRGIRKRRKEKIFFRARCFKRNPFFLCRSSSSQLALQVEGKKCILHDEDDENRQDEKDPFQAVSALRAAD